MSNRMLITVLSLTCLSLAGCTEDASGVVDHDDLSTTGATSTTFVGDDTSTADTTTDDGRETDGDCSNCECITGDVRPCSLEAASCAAAQACVAGRWDLCSATEGDTERCNGIDDDCNGLIDDGLIGCGSCELGLAETCNGVDDDCDGTIDDGLDCACVDTGAEKCNYQDDNCDGTIDEDVKNICGGCGPVPAEVCNYKDDDCDGTIDEGVTNACGVCGPIPQEVCNGGDDDCDGLTDEGLLNVCGGCGPVPAEVCNGLDDDCDGEVDEDAPDCGLSVVWKPFVLSGNATAKIDLPLPYASQIAPLVLIDEYTTNGNDYLFYAANCQPAGDHLTCDVAAGSEGNGSQVRGRIVLLGVGADGEVKSLDPWGVKHGDSNKLLGKLAVDAGHALYGTVLYDHGGDKDFGFALTAELTANTATYRGSGFYGNSDSIVAGYGHLVRFPAGVKAHAIGPVTVFNGHPVALSLQGLANSSAVLPLLSVTAYDTNADDDASWSIKCAPKGKDFTCTVAVTGGNGGSAVTVQGVMLDLG